MIELKKRLLFACDLDGTIISSTTDRSFYEFEIAYEHKGMCSYILNSVIKKLEILSRVADIVPITGRGVDSCCVDLQVPTPIVLAENGAILLCGGAIDSIWSVETESRFVECPYDISLQSISNIIPYYYEHKARRYVIECYNKMGTVEETEVVRQKIEEQVGDRFNVYRLYDKQIFVENKRLTKGCNLARLVDRIGYDYVIAAGNELPDKTMFDASCCTYSIGREYGDYQLGIECTPHEFADSILDRAIKIAENLNLL